MPLLSGEGTTYPPLDTPKPLADNVYVVDSGPLRFLGMPLPVRMTAIRLSGGDLVLHSPTRHAPHLQRELAALGRIRHLVAPNLAHWSYLAEWQRACPDALTWAAPGLRERAAAQKAAIRLDRDLAETPPAEWAGEIAQTIVPGGAGFHEVALFHRPSRTLVLTDLVVNLEASKLPAPMRPLARLLGMVAPDGRAPLYLRLLVKRRGREAAEAAARLVAYEPERVVFAHGRFFERDGAAALARSLRWLLP